MSHREFKVGDRVYYPHPILNDQNEISHFETRIGVIATIRLDKVVCDISAGANQVLNVKLSDLKLNELQ